MTAPSSVSHVWYVAYGSNMHRSRLECYLAGGRPVGGARDYPGCRESGAPAAARAVVLPGVVHFATESVVWGGGGRAFYDPGGEGLVLGRAFLVTAGQFSDIAAQEMYRQPGQDLDLAAVVARGRVEFGPGRYETVVCAGEMDGVPLLTFTAPWGVGDVESRPPSVAYLRHIVAGLREAGDWEGEEIAAYLGACPGVAGRWTAGDLLRLLP